MVPCWVRVHDCVAKFGSIHCVCQEVGNSCFNEAHLQDCVHRRPIFRLLRQALVHKPPHPRPVEARDLWVLSSQDFQHQPLHVACFKCMLQRGHLVENAPKRPDVRFVVVRLVLANLGRQVVRGSDCGPSQFARASQHFCNPEITKLYNIVPRQENILCLQISEAKKEIPTKTQDRTVPSAH